ncbi:MAG TPA: serine/threonine-protein kinase [Longimicrobiales bacterium]
MRNRPAQPRRLGLLTDVGGGPARAVRRRYPYAVGDRIAGDLTVIGHLAAGRLGHLYQVWSAREWCAFTCKILTPSLREDRRAVAALRREARVLRRVDHPNLIRSFGEGEHDGLPYLLMEYIEGPSVFDLLERRPERRIGIADAVRVAIHVGAGLYHLHRRGYLHLDLKPANLLLRSAVPVLSDFDAARRIRPGRRPRERMGTAPYMAPEQVVRAPLSPATDVYGLGAVLYELVTGRWPFEAVYAGEEPRSGEEARYPQLGGAPPPPPARYNPEISPELDALILRCLSREPEDRPASMHPVLLSLMEELDAPTALWPEGVPIERRRTPRDSFAFEAAGHAKTA